MKELFYYSIFAVILYFVLTAVFDNFSLEQENFDPSLVPVSSIITLAKVAQKLVNGNGTLTNPGNLQIGSSTSAPGNLTVTGNANINGTLFVGNDNIVKIITDRVNTLDSSLNNKVNALESSLTNRANTLENSLNSKANALDTSLNSKATTFENSLNSRISTLDTSLNNKVNTLENSLKSKATELASSFTTSALTVGGNATIDGSIAAGSAGIATTGNIMSYNGYVGYNAGGWLEGARFTRGLYICDPAAPTKCANLTFDSAKGILRLDSGLEVRNALGKPGDDNPGIITPNLVFSHADYGWTGSAQSGIQNYSAKVLNKSWIPNGSQAWVGARNDYEGQLHGSVKRAEASTAGRIISMYFNTVEWDGKYYFN